MKQLKKTILTLVALLLAACEKSIIDEKTGQELPADASYGTVALSLAAGTYRLTADPDWDAVNGYTF